jgi:hypothetical protein
MRRQKGWGRRLRNVAAHLTNSAQEVFGPADGVNVRPPREAPQREDGPSDEHPHTAARSSSKADRLPPRERRGRD